MNYRAPVGRKEKLCPIHAPFGPHSQTDWSMKTLGQMLGDAGESHGIDQPPTIFLLKTAFKLLTC
jgi:hypothetical protein